MIILPRKNNIEKHQVVVEKKTKIGKNFNIERYIGVLKLAKQTGKSQGLFSPN